VRRLSLAMPRLGSSLTNLVLRRSRSAHCPDPSVRGNRRPSERRIAIYRAAGLRLLQLGWDILRAVTDAERDLGAHEKQYRRGIAHSLGGHTCFDWLMPVMDEFRKRWPGVARRTVVMRANVTGINDCHLPSIAAAAWRSTPLEYSRLR